MHAIWAEDNRSGIDACTDSVGGKRNALVLVIGIGLLCYVIIM